MKNLCSKIIGTGSYVPDKILSNADLEKKVDTSDEWIQTRTGITERRIAAKNETASTLGVNAALRALKDASVNPSEIDLILAATGSPDMLFPSTACFIQKDIGAENAAAFDVSAACSGFIYALSVADQYIQTGKYKKILVVAADVISRFIDWEDRSTSVLFGDGAGAVILAAEKKESGRGIISTHIYSDGSLSDLLYLPGGGSSCEITPDSIERRAHFLKMKGNSTFKIAVKKMLEVAQEALNVSSLEISDINLLIPHQANLRIIKAIVHHLNFSMDKTFVNVQKYGNTVSATIPLALDEALKAKRINEGDLVLLVTFGGGMTWGSALIRW